MRLTPFFKSFLYRLPAGSPIRGSWSEISIWQLLAITEWLFLIIVIGLWKCRINIPEMKKIKILSCFLYSVYLLFTGSEL
jgi:hypothetical protein